MINTNDSDFSRELKEIEAESMGWHPLDHRVYLHRGAQANTPTDMVNEVVSIAYANLAGLIV